MAQKKIRVLHSFGALSIGGVPTCLLLMCRYLDRECFQNDFLVYTNEPSALEEEFKKLGSKIIRCPYLNNPLIFSYKYIKLLKQHGPYDVIHCHSGYLNGWLLWLAKQAGIKQRLAHSHMVLSPLESNPALSRRFYQSLMRKFILRYMTLGLAVSREAAEDTFGLDWEKDPRIEVLPCSIDLEPFRQPVNREEVRRELDIPPQALVVGHVGRFVQVKNQSLLIDIAVELTKQQDLDFRILLIGDGPLKPDLETRVKHAGLSGKVIFAGVRRDVARLMLGAMNVFVFPSLSEGLGNARLEAQAAGLPCLITDTLPEEGDVVLPLVKRLPLAAPPAAWAQAILEWHYHPPAIDRREALTRMEQSIFSPATAVKKLIVLYRGGKY